MQLSEAPSARASAQRFALPDEVASEGERSFQLGWAATAGEVAEAQRLRFRVFAGEMGARIHPPAGTQPGHDADAFDPHCAHLLVRAAGAGRAGEVIATCRVLTPEGARQAQGLYTAGEFDLAPLRDLLPNALEMGRMCVDADWRNGLVVMAIWRELGRQLVRRGFDAMIGCSSVGMADGGQLARQMWHDLRHDHLALPEHQVLPRKPLPMPATDGPATQAVVPALIKGYLRLGGRLLGPPAIDADFNTADFPMMLRIADMPARYSRRILGA